MKERLKSQIGLELEKPTVLIGGTVIIVLAFIQFLLVPWLNWRSETYDYIQHQKSNTRSEQVLLKAQQEVESRSSELKKQLYTVESWLFEGDTESTKIKLQLIVEESAKDNELEISSWSSKSAEVEGGLVVAEMRVRGDGTLNGLEQFVYHVESYNKFLYVKEYEMKKSFSNLQDKLEFNATILLFASSENGKEL